MKTRTSYPVYRDDNAPSSSWLSTTIDTLCAPFASCLDWKPRRSKSPSLTSISWPLGRSSDQDLLIGQDDEKQPRPVYEQPMPHAAPLATRDTGLVESEKPPRKSFASSRTVLSMKKRFQSDGSNRRPQISAPSDFRHLQSNSFQFPATEDLPPVPRPRNQGQVDRSMFRPLELSIYMPNRRMSPILPLFEFPNIVPPGPAYLQDRLDEHHELVRQRSNSSMPFHIPRKRAGGSLSSPARDSAEDHGAPTIPAKSSARARAYTSPEVEQIKTRVAGAMIEVEKLQRQIDDVVERQSLYASSRPSTSHSMARTMPGKSSMVAHLARLPTRSLTHVSSIDLEPMPDIPALPPSAPSFAERLHNDIERPQTAPLKSALEISNRSQDFETAASTPTRVRREDTPLAPPLPLVLRPPLRKKKSFSRVSTWLFPGSSHNRDISFDSVTNQPRPIKGTEGFFQCVQGADAGRTSFDSIDTVSTYETEDEQRTVPTTWSPGSTPATKQEESSLSRVATFGNGSSSSARPYRSNAIVAS